MQALVLTVAATITAPLVLGYDAKFDSVDVDKIIADDTLFSAYLNCLLDKGPCDAEYSDQYKELLPEVVATACAKCSAKQRSHVRKSVNAVQAKKPDDFKLLIAKYDPNGEHKDNFIAFMSASD